MMSIPVRSRIASGSRLAPPRRRQVDLPRVADLRGHERDQPLAARGDVLVVGVRLVELEHRELGVVGRVDALVAEVLAELVHALEAADDQPLEVELGRDPQVELAVQRVVVGRERPGQRRRRTEAAAPASRPRRTPRRRGSAGRRRSPGRAVMNSSRASSLAIRSSSRRRKRVSTSVSPWCFSGGGRSDLASSVNVLAPAASARRAGT